jgi:dolichol-phosphate mannosyltransferase
MSLRLSIVIPFHNESENITPLITKVDQVVSQMDLSYEIIAIDDASTDDTYQILQRLTDTFPKLRLIHHVNNCGQSTSVVTGIRHAEGEFIATLDGDGQNDPADIPKLYNAMTTSDNPNLKMVAGYRKKRKDTIFKRWGSKLANAVRSSLLKDATPDTGCGLKLFYRETFLRLPYFDHMHRFLPALVQRDGGDVISVEVNHFPRIHGTSHYNNLQRLWVGIIDLMGVMWLIKRSHRPQIEEYKKSPA